MTDVVEGNTNFNHNKSCKTWAFTLNNYNDEDIERFKRYTVSRLVVGKEIGEQGTPHLQGWITFKRGYRPSQLKKLEPRVHWEFALTTDGENYCMKDGTDVVINVDNRNQGQRTDLKAAVTYIKESGIKRFREEMGDVYVKYHNGFDKIGLLNSKKRTEKPNVVWIYGPTGCGKTSYVYDKHPDLWISNEDLKWFDGYDGQETVLFDDFRGDMCKFRFLLRLLDRYPLKVPIKGGFVEWTPKNIYITSCKDPKNIYNKETFDNEEKVDQLLRRIDDIIFMNSMSMSQ